MPAPLVRPAAAIARTRRPWRRPIRGLASFSSWLVVAAAALFTYAWVSALVGEAQAARDELGDVTAVVVATGDISRGEILGPDDVRIRTLPVAHLADGALRSSDPGGVTGRVVLDPIAGGEVLLDRRLAPAGADRATALAATGARVLSIDRQRRPTSARPGDLADLVAVDTIDGRATTVARDVTVVEVTEDAVAVSLAPADVEPAAASVAAGTVVLAVHRP